jgi:hypothetical protein
VFVYFLLCVYICIGIFFFNPRKTMMIGSVSGIGFTLFQTAPELCRCFNDSSRVFNFEHHHHHISFLPIATITIIMGGIAMLYVFNDGDLPPKGKKSLVLATHDIIHFLSLIVILNLCYYNCFLLTF